MDGTRRDLLGGLVGALSTDRRIGAVRTEVVFIGDSLTRNWADKMPEIFTGEWANKGIGGDTTPGMWKRFEADVVSLRPRVVHILGGINDLRNAASAATLERVKAQVANMTSAARVNGIRPVIAAILPLAEPPPWEHLRIAFNRWAQSLPQVGFVDYGDLLVDGRGALAARYSVDGLHINRAAYEHITPRARAAVAL